uniref:Uncharacterized protein n=1 Tax=viral metagenome TaxID=1070528 RepID=A0A6M3JT19_9ZZZZ
MTDVYTALEERTCMAPGARVVVSANVPATAGDYLVPIPFRGRLVHCQTSVVVAVGATNAITLKLEKDAAGGTSLGSATIAASAAVGTEDTATLTAGATDDTMTLDNQDICLAVTGSQTTGNMNVFMIFEHARTGG